MRSWRFDPAQKDQCIYVLSDILDPGYGSFREASTASYVYANVIERSAPFVAGPVWLLL